MGLAESTVDGDPSMADFERILHVCAGFEAEWRRGNGPRIEEYLARNSSFSRRALLRELLALELELARADGANPTAGEYRGRFSDCALVVDALFVDSRPATVGPRAPAAGRDRAALAEDVDDAATAALMTRFYEYLWGEKLSAIESLRRAQLEMLDGRLPVGGNARGIGPPQAADPKASRLGERVHPRFWAAWTVSGAPAEPGPR